MVLPATKLSTRRAKKSSGGVHPLSAEERGIFDKVSACPVQRVPVERLRPSAGHARIHDDAKLAALIAAIQRFGFVEPILVDQNFTIISGVARWTACQKLGLAEVPVIVVSHLSAKEVRALR